MFLYSPFYHSILWEFYFLFCDWTLPLFWMAPWRQIHIPRLRSQRIKASLFQNAILWSKLHLGNIRPIQICFRNQPLKAYIVFWFYELNVVILTSPNSQDWFILASFHTIALNSYWKIKCKYPFYTCTNHKFVLNKIVPSIIYQIK